MSEPVAGEITEYGFRWGAAEVTRCAEHRGTVCIVVAGDVGYGEKVEIYVSPKGRSVQVWKNGVRLDG